jgi:ABC-type multidrug transport system fused ATPase/permease subunit
LSLWFAKSAGQYTYISNEVFVIVYSVFVVVGTCGIFLRAYMYAYSSISKSRQMHSKMFASILYAKSRFFDSTPLGRILNAFAGHQYGIDFQLADYLMQLLKYLVVVTGAPLLMMIIMYQTIPIFVVALVFIFLILLFEGNVEAKLRDQETITKSSIFSHLTATLEGLFSIRAYECQQRFIDIFEDKIDENNKYQFAGNEVKRWLAFYIDVLTSFIIYVTVILIVLLVREYPPSTSGLVLSNVLQLLVFLQWTVRMCGDCHEKVASIKQISYYGNSVEQEALAIVENNRPPKEWPARGQIHFSDVWLRYQEGGACILKGVTIDIKPKEKIGIVGRTGSGKSTLLISLLRIVELCEGEITIDGIDVSKIGLKDLRSRIAIIPQETILFVGTIRENVDLFNKCTDEEIWKALESVHMANTIRKLEKKLDSPVIGKCYLFFM